MFKRVLALLIALCILPACSLAALRRGDKGEEVRSLQSMLLETGWLFEEPDGVFGRNTEKAVRDFERNAGLPADGIADDQMMDALYTSWLTLLQETGQLQSGEGALADGRYPAFCALMPAADGVCAVDLCQTHAQLAGQADSMRAQEAAMLWRSEVERLYGTWLACTQEDQHPAIIAARDQYLAAADAQHAAIEAYYAGFQIVPDSSAAYDALLMMHRHQAAWLCALISGSLTGYHGPEH